jgi:hypothetical protein
MGFRLFRRIRIAPGLGINLSKSGISLSAGVRGARVTVGPRGVRRTVGIPGTGISYTSTGAKARTRRTAGDQIAEQEEDPTVQQKQGVPPQQVMDSASLVPVLVTGVGMMLGVALLLGALGLNNFGASSGNADPSPTADPTPTPPLSLTVQIAQESLSAAPGARVSLDVVTLAGARCTVKTRGVQLQPARADAFGAVSFHWRAVATRGTYTVHARCALGSESHTSTIMLRVR